MKKNLLFLLFCIICTASFAQVTVNQGFENSGSLPAGWTSSIGSGSYNWAVVTSGTSPTCSAHGGSYVMNYASYSQSSGGYAILLSPVIDWSVRGGVATTVTMWFYRDCSAYNTSSFNLEGVTAYVNTAASLTGAVSMGFVPRAGSQSISGGVTGTATTTASGWYQYTFTVPTTYNSSSNYIIFKAYSQFGDNQYMDDVSYTAYPCLNSAIGGYSGAICNGSTLTLSDATAGGRWSSSAASVASIGSVTGILSALTAGTSVISYIASCGTVVTTTVSVLAAPGASTGNTPVCQGNTVTLANASGTGTWATTATGTATVNATTGVVTGVSAGIAPVTYTLAATGCNTIANVTVNTTPATITGGLSVCAGSASALATSPSGGVWTSSNPSSATIGSSSGSVAGIASGSSVISYTMPTGCATNTAFTVNPQPTAITGVAVFCGTQSTTLSATPAGGVWSSSNTSVAVTSAATGNVTGISTGGPATISYILPAGCFSVLPVIINPLSPVTGVPGTCIGATAILGDATTGGAWSSSNSSVATIGASTGVLTGVSSGVTTISYTMPATGCVATASKTITGSPAVYNTTGGGAFCPGGTGVHVGLNSSAVGFNYQMSLGGSLTGIALSGTGGSLDFGLVTTSGIYTVVANPGTTCVTNMAAAATVSNYSLPTAFAVTGGGNYCAGGTGVHVYLSSSARGITYQLFNGTAITGSPVSGAGGVIDFGLQTVAGTYTVLATNIASTCTNLMSGSAAISVNSQPTAFALTGGGSFCVGGTGAVVGLSSSAPGVNYQLYKGGVATGAPVAGGGASISFGAQSLAGSYTIVALNPATGCNSNMTGAVAVSVNALPVAYPVTGGGAHCPSDSGVHIGLGGSSAGVNYQASLSGVALGGIVAGTGAAIDFGLVTGSGNYTVLATNAISTCISTMTGIAAVTLNPAPSAFNVGGGGTYCSGGSGVHITLSGSEVRTSYFLYNGTALIGGCSGTGAAVDFGLKTAAGTYTATATLRSGGCSNNMTGSSVITINAVNVYTVSGGGSYCSGSTGPHVLQSSSSTGVNYQLLRNGSPVGTAVTGTGAAIDFGAQTTAGAYTVSATNTTSGCTANMSGTAAVTINATPAPYVMTGGGAYCSGGTGVRIGLGGSNTGISYSLSNAGIPVGTVVTGTGGVLDFGLQTAVGTYTVIATNTTTSCTGNMTGSAAISTNSLPGSYPVTGGGNYCTGTAGRHVGLSSSTAGITYQLYNGASVSGAAITGTGSALDFGLQTASGSYTILARNPVTTCTASMTGSAAITATPLPAAYTVTGGGSTCAGGTGVHIGLGNSASGVSYQLFNGTTAGGTAIAGTGAALDFGLQTTGGSYTVIATNTASGCTGNMTGSALVSAGSGPAAHTVTGGGSYCAGGMGLNIGLDGSTAGTSYQLYSGGLATGSVIAGTGASLSFGSQTSAASYTVIATNTTTGCTGSMTGSAAILISTHPTSYTVTGGGGYCPGGAGVHLGLSGSDSSVDYALYNGTYTGITMAGTGRAIDFGLQSLTGAYTVVATSTSSTCTGNMTGATSVFLTTPPAIHNVTGGGNYCAGTGAGVHVSLDGSNTGTSYQLYKNHVAAGATMAGTGAPIDFGSQAAATYTIVAINGGACSNDMTGSAIVSARPLPVAFAIAGGGNYCNGGAGVTISLGGSETGVVYQLLAGGAPAGAAIAGTGSTLDFGLKTVTGSYIITATNLATSCSNNMTGGAIVGVNPSPVAFPVAGGGAYCTGDTGVSVSLISSDLGITYQLYNGTASAVAPQSGTGAALNFGAQTSAGSYTVIAENSLTGCTSNMSGSVAISTIALPAAYTLSPGGSYCAGGTGVRISLGASAIGITYQLLNDASATGSPLAGTGRGIDFGMQATSGTYTVVALDPMTGCKHVMTGTAPVSINALPVVYHVSGSGTSYCAGGAGIGININSSDAGVSYQLYHGSTPVGIAVSGAGSSLSFGAQTVSGVYTVAGTTTASGCGSTMAGSASVSINSLPVAYSVTGGGGYCTGGTGTHIGLGGSSAGVLYQLYESGIPVGTHVSGTGAGMDMGLHTVAGNYTISALNPATGCENRMTGSATVSVAPVPVVYTVSGGGSFCAGGAGAGISLSGSETGTTYQLMTAAATTGTPAAGTGRRLDLGLHTGAGNYTVVAANTATGCTSHMAGTATIAILPVPSAHVVNGGGSYCAGGAGKDIGTTGSDAGVSYQLYNGPATAGTAVAGTGRDLDFGTQAAAGNYTVIAVNTATSCMSNMPGSAIIVVNQLPVAYTVTGGGNYCQGTAGVHAGISGSDMGVTYGLYNAGSLSASFTGSGSAIDFGLLTTPGAYTVQATNTVRCSNDMAGATNIAIINTVTPSASIFSGSGDSVCAGVKTTFTATGDNTGTTPAYQWTVNGALKSTQPSFGYTPADGDLVNLVVTSSAACAVPAQVNAAMNVKVLSVQTPVVTVSANPGVEVCRGTEVTYSAAPVYGGSAPAYLWKKNGVTMSGSAAFHYTPLAGDVVTCEMTSNYQCRQADIANSAPLQMVVDTPVVPSVAITAFPSLHIAEGENETLTATVTNGGPAPEFQWYVNGTAVQGATTASFSSSTLANADVVSCRVLGSGGCTPATGAASTTIIVLSVSVANVSASLEDVKLLPNPNNGSFVVKGNTAAAAGSEITIEITNMVGQVIYNNKVVSQNGGLNENIQLSNNVANGMYLLTLHSGAETKVLHVVVER